MNSRIVSGWRQDAAVASAGATPQGDLVLLALHDGSDSLSVVALRVDATAAAAGAPSADLLWTLTLPEGELHTAGPYGFRSQPSVVMESADNGYFVVGRRRVLVDLKTGTALADIGSAGLPSGPAVVTDGKLFVPEGRELAVYEAQSLETMARRLAPEDLWTHGISSGGEVCAVRSLATEPDGERAALWRLRGDDLWSLDGAQRLIMGAVLETPEAVLVATSQFGPCADRVTALDRVSGRILWDAALPDIPSNRHGPQAFYPAQTLMAAGPLAIVLTDAPGVVAIRADEGRLLWSLPLTQCATAQANVGDKLWVGSEDARIVVVDLATGAIVKSHVVTFPPELPQWPVAILTTSSPSLALVVGSLGAVVSVSAD